MAKETITVTRCDVCGESRDDVQTWILRMDGKVYEIDVDQKTDRQHSLPVAELVKHGREVNTTGRRRHGDNRFLEGRIRATPPVK